MLALSVPQHKRPFRNSLRLLIGIITVTKIKRENPDFKEIASGGKGVRKLLYGKENI